MATESIPWDQRPGYLAAIATTVAPGELTAYRKLAPKCVQHRADMMIGVPRPVGSSPTDVTAFMPGYVDSNNDIVRKIEY